MTSSNVYTRRSLALTASLAILLLLAPACPDATPSENEVTVTKDVTYGVGNVSDGSESAVWEEKPLLLDVYRPEGVEGPLPAVLLVHGGNFTEGSKEKEEIVEFATYFAGRGYVAFAMNYRLAGDHPPAPSGWGNVLLTAAAHAAMVDVKAAVRFIRAEADMYGVDPERIALMGESAGAIAGVTTAVTESDEYSTDDEAFPLPEENHPGVSARVQAYIHLWGNADHVLLEVTPDDPPVMIVHGTEDDRIGASFGASERFDTALRIRGVPHIFYEAEGYGHGAWDYRRRGRNLKGLVLDFMDEYLPPPT